MVQRKRNECRGWSAGDNPFFITAMDSISYLLDVLSTSPELAAQLSLTQINHFITHCAHVKNDIIITQPSNVPLDIPPEFIPSSLIEFLSDLLGLEDDLVVFRKYIANIVATDICAQDTLRNARA